VIRVTRDRSVLSLSAETPLAAEVQQGESFLLETSDCFCDQVQSADDVYEAADAATRDIARLLMTRLGITAGGAASLMSAAGQLQVSQVVDPLKTARFAMSRELLAPLGELV
jgi:amidase